MLIKTHRVPLSSDPRDRRGEDETGAEVRSAPVAAALLNIMNVLAFYGRFIAVVGFM